MNANRRPWFCGLIHHVLDQEVGGSNLAATKSLLGENEDWVKNDTMVGNNGLKKQKGQLEVRFKLRISSGGTVLH